MDPPFALARPSRIAAFVGALALCAPVHAQRAVYRIDPARSSVHFQVEERGISSVRGRFGPVQGQVELDRQAARGSARITIVTASVRTGLRGLDKRMRDDDLLATRAHPRAFFVSDSFVFEAGVLNLPLVPDHVRLSINVEGVRD